MSGRALITGITGQDGYYLTKLLLGKGYEVFGLTSRSQLSRYSVQSEFPMVTLIEGDLRDQASLVQAITLAEPTEVYNLGAYSFVKMSFASPIDVADVTGVGVGRLLEAIRLVGAPIRFYQASSSEIFGKVQQVPQTEVTPLYPRSPYGAAKAYGHHITVNYREAYGMHASSGILFNHESPRRGMEFVTRKISNGVARIKLGIEDTLALGNLDAKRDWGFAGDYVEAMWMMLQQETADDYVIATGETHSVRDFVVAAFKAIGEENWQRYVVQDERFMRPAEVDLLIGDPSKARAALGWKPRVSFEELVAMMVEHDVEHERARRG